jgi:archaellum component FlaC
MTNPKELFENVVETHTKALNSFVETAAKFQDAFKTGKTFEQTTDLYKNWWDTQVALLNNVTTTANKETENTYTTSVHNVEDFYKNIYNSQLDAIKKATEFNLNMYNSLNSFGKSTTDATENYTTLNSNWNTLFESWTKTLNSTFETLNKTMPNTWTKDLFTNAYTTNTLYTKLQEFYQPFFTSFQNNNYSVDSWKNIFNPTNYKNVTEELFSSYFPTNNLNSLLENNTKMVQEFLNSFHTTNSDFKNYWSTLTEKYPSLISGDWAKFSETFKNVNNSYTEFFAPVMKLVTNTKEKENLELTVTILDKTTLFSTKLAQMQYLLYTTGQKVAQNTLNYFTEKSNDTTYTTSFQPMFNEWVNINETVYTELFNTDEFSKLKAELTTLSMEIKTNLEKQFENKLEHYPVVVKSELEDLYKTIHDLKKTVKTLESKLTTTTTETTAPKTTKKVATV